MLSHFQRRCLLCLLLLIIIRRTIFICTIVVIHMLTQPSKRLRRRALWVRPYGMVARFREKQTHRDRLYMLSDSDCLANLRMNVNTFARLCFLLRELGNLRDQKYVTVEEQVSIFLSVLAHHKKNRVVRFDFLRSGQTVSRYVHIILKAVLKLHHIFLVNPTLVPNDSTNPRWKWFKGCLGALDGTYIDVHVRAADRGPYRTRKGRISTNVLGVCDPDMRFIYVLPEWEGSASDSRVLRDSLNRPRGFRVPRGNYYLCDNGYANSEGFLVPYRGCRYHLKEWGPNTGRPANAKEHFNMRHTRARNVIERAFGVLKMHFGILKSPTYYPIQTQIRLIMSCFLLHNFIRSEMPEDPMEELLDNATVDPLDSQPPDMIDTVESTPESHNWRETMAQTMYQTWRNGG